MKSNHRKKIKTRSMIQIIIFILICLMVSIPLGVLDFINETISIYTFELINNNILAYIIIQTLLLMIIASIFLFDRAVSAKLETESINAFSEQIKSFKAEMSQKYYQFNKDIISIQRTSIDDKIKTAQILSITKKEIELEQQKVIKCFDVTMLLSTSANKKLILIAKRFSNNDTELMESYDQYIKAIDKSSLYI